jgi:hypothetical protein
MVRAILGIRNNVSLIDVECPYASICTFQTEEWWGVGEEPSPIININTF